MSINLLFTALLVLGSSGVFAQKGESDFTYSTTSEIGKKTSLIAVDITPVKFGYQGSHVAFGVAGRGVVSDIKDKFSCIVNYDYNYFNFSVVKDRLTTVVEDYAENSTSALGAVIGYNFKREVKSEIWSTRLKRSGNVEYVADFPTKVIYRYEARLGFDRIEMLSRGDISYADTIYDDWGNNPKLVNLPGSFHLNQRQNVISFGVARKTSIDNVYSTDKFGVVTQSLEKLFYGDLLIGLGGELPQFFSARYDDEYYPNEISSIEPLGANAETGVNDSFRRLPIGMRVGFIQSSRRMHGFSWDAQLAFYPGFYKSIAELIQFKVGFSYRFTKLLD